MRKTSVLAAVLASLLGTGTLFAADAAKKTPTTAPSTQPSAKSDAIVNKFCAVEGGDNKVDSKIFTVYKGQKVGFCCSDCIKEFKKDPEKYVKAMK